jgi:hypothetical protein
MPDALRAPDVQAKALSNSAYVVMPGCYWQAQGSRPAISKRLFAPVHACRRCGVPPLVKVPRAHRLEISLIDGLD